MGRDQLFASHEIIFSRCSTTWFEPQESFQNYKIQNWYAMNIEHLTLNNEQPYTVVSPFNKISKSHHIQFSQTEIIVCWVHVFCPESLIPLIIEAWAAC